MNKSKSYTEEIVELTKRNERIFLETLHELMEVKRALASRRTRTEHVRDMFVRVLPHQERNDRPTVPSEAAIRLQTRIDCEEFVEKLAALYENCETIVAIQILLDHLAKNKPIRKDLHDRLPEFADALADNAVTNEGFAVLFGIDLESVFQEVHASNMRKGDGPIVDGKRRKPEGWVGPDMVGVLRKQGWSPSIEAELDKPIQYAIGPKAMEDPSTYATCTVHQIAFDEAFGCARCENAQYNGSEIDPVGEVAEDRPEEISPYFRLGVCDVFGTIGDPITIVKFFTNDTSLISRCQIYRDEQTKIITELSGITMLPLSVIQSVNVESAVLDGPRSIGMNHAVTVQFRKVD